MTAARKLEPKAPAITFEVSIDLQTIAYLMISACEGATSYWCRRISLVNHSVPIRGAHWYADPALYADPTLVISVQHASNGVTRKFGIEGIRQGLELMARKWPHHLKDILKDSGDATTADVFLQCCALKDIVYG